MAEPKKNRGMVYILLLVFLGIWAVVVYRIFSAVNGNSAEQGIAVVSVDKTAPDTAYREAYPLIGAYRDPFLGTVTLPKDTSVRKRPLRVQKVEKQAFVPIDWQFIKYLGMISNKQTSRKVALVRIYERELSVKEGELVDGVQFIVFKKDSMLISYQGQHTTIVK